MNNWVTSTIDWLGAITVIYRDPAAWGHYWVETHRNNRMTTAAGFYPNGSIFGDTGQVVLGRNEAYADHDGKDKQLVAVYETTALQEAAFIQTAYDAYNNIEPYNVNPLSWPTWNGNVCWDFTDLIQSLAEQAGLENKKDTYIPADRKTDSQTISDRANLTFKNMSE